jgi:hypothetical protein
VNHRHALQTLARSGPISVDLCACGVVHLGINAVTLHFDERAFAQFVQVLVAAEFRRQAQQRIEAEH